MWLRSIVFIFLVLMSVAGCSDDEVNGNDGGTSGNLILNYQVASSPVVARAVQTSENEQKVQNLYVMVFNSDGDKEESTLLTCGGTTSGTVKMNAFTGSGKKVVVVANVDMTVTLMESNVLKNVVRYSDLAQVEALLKNQNLERGKSFLMTAELTNQTIGKATTLSFVLKRVDAKLEVSIGAKDNTITFEPQRWRIVNVPSKVRLFGDASVAFPAGAYFTAPWRYFEKSQTSKSGRESFGIYVFPSALNPTLALTSEEMSDANSAVRLREKRTSEGAMVYAPQLAPYLEIEGIYTEKGQAIQSDVRYYVHLGDITTKNFNDYRVVANTAYQYTLTVESINSLKIEVTQDNSDNPQVDGDILDNSEGQLFSFDAHYGQSEFSIPKSVITSKPLSWQVSTPFTSGFSDLTTADYKWLGFKVYPKSGNSIKNSGYYSSVSLASYYSNWNKATDQMMTLPQFVAFLGELKTQAGNYSGLFTDDSLRVCVFVDEYYYANKDVKLFVNQPDRIANISFSYQNSSSSQGAFAKVLASFRQKSIITVYNMDATGTEDIWGVESEMEGGRKKNFLLKLNKDNAMGADNGYSNTTKLWEDYWNKKPSSGYADYVQYACMTRNRDENNDGKIQRDELKWYLADLHQLIGLWVGEGALPPSTQLYNANTANYIVSGVNEEIYANSSSCHEYFHGDYYRYLYSLLGCGSSNNLTPKAYYSNSGFSLSADPSEFSYRCVRNLRNTNATGNTSFFSLDKDKHIITMNKLNPLALRLEKVNGALDAHNERSEENKLYKKFEYDPTSLTIKVKDYSSIDDAVAKNNLRVSDKKWRMPNQRELKIMEMTREIVGSDDKLYFLSATKSSLGMQNNKSAYYVYHDGDFTTISSLDNSNTYKIVYVRDVD